MDTLEEGESSSSWGIWKSGGGTGEESGESSSSKPDNRTRYEPAFDDSVEKMIKIDTKSIEFEHFFAHESKMLAEVISVGSIKFDVELERVQVDHEDHKDLIVHVVCHRDGLDPHWRCSFHCDVSATVGDVNAKASGQKADARYKDNCLTMPVMRLPSEPVDEAVMTVYIKMSKWKGFHPRLLHDFTKQNEYTNVTLVVEEQPLYVTREILSIHSAFFNNLFFNENFNDAGKEEYILPDVSYADMLLFLNLSYPETMVGQRERFIKSIEDVERILLLSEQFTAPALKTLVERLLRSTPSECTFLDTHWTRLLYIADRFRLSEACSTQMRRLKTETDYIRLRRSEEFELLSARLRSKILTGAIEKLPVTIVPRKARVASRTGRIGQYSDVEVDDDEDSDCEIIRTDKPSLSTSVPSIPSVTVAQQTIPAGPAQPSAANLLVASAAATAFAPTARPRTNQRGVWTFTQDDDDIPTKIAKTKKAFKRRMEVEREIKEEMMSEDDMEEEEDDDDQPGPSNRLTKRSTNSKSGVTTRSRSKRVKKKTD